MTNPNAKRNQAMIRAMPVTRMQDYGLTRTSAKLAHHRAQGTEIWEDILNDIAVSARTKGDMRDAAAAANFAQMASNFDTLDRIAAFRQSISYFSQYVATHRNNVEAVKIRYNDKFLYGWDASVPDKANAPAIIVIGGMSGWATSFYGVAESLNARGFRCLLIDGPGQGQSRIDGGLFIQDGFPEAIAKGVDHLYETGCHTVGIWGNSMGGVFAAASACADQRITACCINGAPTTLAFPAFRTAQEQLAAMFGARSFEECENSPEVAETFAALSFDPQKVTIPCPVLICEGGADLMVPLGSQGGFLVGNTNQNSTVETWKDGEHTIYNHAADRNDRVSNWFATVFKDIGG